MAYGNLQRTDGGSRPGTVSVGGAAATMLGLLALLWVLEVVDLLTGHWLDSFGILARDLDGLPGIISAPFLHFGFEHLINNSLPFFVLGFFILLGGVYRWVVSSLVSIVTSGLAAWALTPSNTMVLGASGLIFGWFSYLVVRGFLTRNVRQIVIGVLVLIVYGGMVSGIFPTSAGVSWQAHLGGAVGGVLAALLLHRRESRTTPASGNRRY